MISRGITHDSTASAPNSYDKINDLTFYPAVDERTT
jgi:hypothetical protein